MMGVLEHLSAAEGPGRKGPFLGHLYQGLNPLGIALTCLLDMN